MSLIPCTGQCVYQKDGYCNLERAASSGVTSNSVSSACVNFVEKKKLR